MNKELVPIIEEWKLYRKLTLDLLDKIPESKLDFAVGKNMGSLGKQFRHIGDVQLCYIEAIKSGKIDFTKYRRDYSIEKSKRKLKAFLNEMDKELFSLLGEMGSKKLEALKIDWGFGRIPLPEHLKYLIQHEILHQGELIVYIRTLGMNFPPSWKTWGL